MKKSWKSSLKPESPKVDLDQSAMEEIVNSMALHGNDQEKFLESFCHKYSNINCSVEGGFSERMKADIEKRARKTKEIQKAEELFQLLNQKPIDKEEKEE